MTLHRENNILKCLKICKIYIECKITIKQSTHTSADTTILRLREDTMDIANTAVF